MPELASLSKCPRCLLQQLSVATACPSCGYLPSAALFAQQKAQQRRQNLLWAKIALLMSPVLVLAFVIASLSMVLRSTFAYREALRLASSSADVQAVLGSGVHPRLPVLVLGWTFSAYSTQFSEFSVALTGSKASGRLYAVANSGPAGVAFSRLAFISNSTAEKIDLTPSAGRLALPQVPTKHVFLVPLGLDANQPLDWAPAYYKARMGIEVTILPPASMLPTQVNLLRKQLDAESVVEYLKELHPEVVADPSAVLVGITSHDLYIPSFDWDYAENFRHDGRFAIISSARFRPFFIFDRLNPEWFHSRFRKMLTKNLVVLCFDLPLSSDYTSLLSGAVRTGQQIDMMGDSLIGTAGRWHPLLQSGGPNVVIYSVLGKPLVWRLAYSREALPQVSSHVFDANVALGLFSDRVVDFLFDGDDSVQFRRVYRNQDPRSRSFGIGASHSLDIFLVGEMGVYGELILEDGARVHYDHVPTGPSGSSDAYVERGDTAGPFSRSVATFSANTWTIALRDGSRLYFPYRPKALEQYVTVLTGFTDTRGRKYEMMRDAKGHLLSLTTPTGKWLHFENDSENRIRHISDSQGLSADYVYDQRGCLTTVTTSEGTEDRYSYDDKGQMLAVSRGSDPPIVVNEYTSFGQIASQKMADGGMFVFHYMQDPSARGTALIPDLITEPNGLLTHIKYNSQDYLQSLPTLPPH